jgi:pimeloyl-ACP methyl ester carboxylesterase
LLKILGIDKTHIFGISVGGMIAQKFALNHPEMVDRLVLGCTMPNFFYLPPATEDSERLQTTQLVTPEESVEIMMHLFLSEKFFTASPDLTAELRDVMLTEKFEQGEEPFLLQLGAAMSHDTLEQVKNITAPTLVITGDLDPMAPVENARFLAEKIPDSTLVELPGVRHAFWVEKFEESSKVITDFLLKG